MQGERSHEKQHTQEWIGVLADGIEVFDRPRSHAVLDESMRTHLREALRVIEVDVHAPVKAYVHDFDRTIGTSRCVATTDADEIVYARRINRRGHSRFVKNRDGEPTSKLTLVLMKNEKTEEQYYILITAFYGAEVPREPWDRHAEPGAREYWNTHALVWDPSVIVPGTETRECPW